MEASMADFLTKRGSFWRFCRRVPQEYAHLDTRGIVQESTKIRIADDPKAIRASQKANRLNADLESYWRGLAAGKSAEAVRDYEAARRAAKRLQISAPIDDATRRTVAEILDRLETLTGNRAEDRANVLAVFDAAPKPEITFRECATQYIESHKAAWKSDKSAKEWTATLEAYAYPVIGDMPVNKIGGNGDGTDLILKIIQPIWRTKTATAARVRGRIESIIDWAKARGFRAGENPARWKGHLETLLPDQSKVSPTKHLAALPYEDVPRLMKRLRDVPETASLALQFTILTAGRTSETRLARWSEFDLQSRTWIVPAARMKKGREHRVPLCDSAITIIKSMPKRGEYVFAGTKKNKPFEKNGMLKLLGRLGVSVTTHGFRSAFRDWGSEATDYPNEMLEMAIAHIISDKTEASYRRGDLLKKRHRLMADWGAYCNRA
jgi:integrase